MNQRAEVIRHRELHFAPLHPDAHQAHTVLLLLNDVEGIVHTELIDSLRLRVSYNLEYLTLRMLEETLSDFGFHLDNSLLTKLKRALYYYSEEVQRENQKCARGDSNCIQKVFINRYQNLPHGCRDDRPEHWRRYL